MSEREAPQVPAGVCPLCHRSNACAMAAGIVAGTPCWCVGARLDQATLARASAADGGAACVCAACASRVAPPAR
jgi:hypothetical protein